MVNAENKLLLNVEDDMVKVEIQMAYAEYMSRFVERLICKIKQKEVNVVKLKVSRCE